MRITRITSHVLQYDLPDQLGYSQRYYAKHSTHLVEISTNEGMTGWGECFGPGNIALANKTIVETVFQPMVLGMDALDRDAIWQLCHNLTRDHGQKGMVLQSLLRIDIAHWDIAAQVAGLPNHTFIGDAYRDNVRACGHGMMLRDEPVAELPQRLEDETVATRGMGFAATKMKVGFEPGPDIHLAEAVRRGTGDDFPYMVDANHCYTSDAFKDGRALEDLGAYWFEEPVSPEDLDDYQKLRAGLKVNISSGETEFNRWGWNALLEARGLDIAQPEICALGGIREYKRVLAPCHALFTPVVNHVWGSAVAAATNLHLLAGMPPLPGGMLPWEPMLEFDTTDTRFRDELLTEPLEIQQQVSHSDERVAVPKGPGLGVRPDPDFIAHYKIA